MVPLNYLLKKGKLHDLFFSNNIFITIALRIFQNSLTALRKYDCFSDPISEHVGTQRPYTGFRKREGGVGGSE